MSRLDSFIRRLEAQRACIDEAARPGAIPNGPIYEIGLGNGRTYDHLRERFPEREIFAFEWRLGAHHACIPDDEHLVLGDVAATLPLALSRHGGEVALVHYDLASDDAAGSVAWAESLAPLLDQALAPNGLLVSGVSFAFTEWEEMPPPGGVGPGRYFLYRKSRRTGSVLAPVRSPLIC